MISRTLSPVNPIPSARPIAIPKGVPLVDTPRYSSNINEGHYYDREVAWVEFTKAGHRMTVSARIGDANHAGNKFVGTFKEAVGKARVEAALEEIDFPELGAAAILRSHHKGEWIVVPIAGYAPGHHFDGENPPAAAIAIDPEHGSLYGPEGIWRSTGASRAGRALPNSMSDSKQGALRVSAQKVHPDLVAIVGVDRWINFGSKHYAELLEQA